MISHSHFPADPESHSSRPLLHAVPDGGGAGATPVPTDPLIGRRLGGKYMVERLIGRGGAGLVYLARQAQPAREVVVKVLAPHVIGDARSDAAARFDREATRLGGLRHPNVVAMLDHGREDGRAYLVMEYLAGESLSQHLARRGRLSVEEFVPIAAQILKGIGHAHTRELVVRAIEPANVMLCERKGRANFVKILDFGLATLVADDERVTGEHTVGYLAPEVIRGEAIDLRVDVYAIGALFHHMLAGRLPFGEPAAVLPAELDIPPGLVRLVSRCLAKHPDDRPADANAVVEELIDAVPAHLFRLPRAHASATPAGSGNTGMIEIVGNAAVSGPHDAVREDSSPLIDTAPILSTETVPSTPLAGRTFDTKPTAGKKPAFGLVAGAVLAGALMAVLGGTIAAFVFGGDASDDSVAAAGSGVALVDADAASEGLAHAKRLIEEGRLELAGDVLDGVRELVGDAPALQARLERTDRALLVARLMNTAARFEGEGDIASALSTYRDVLATDPTHAVARSRLSRLGAAAEGETSVHDHAPLGLVDGIAYGAIAIDAEPEAELVIDGQPAGRTPFQGRLPIGKHALRITARGHQPWESAVEIAEDDNEPIKVRLHGKAFARSKPTPAKSAAAPVAASKAAADPGRPAEPKSKPEVFLPNKAERGGGVFLPTKE